MKKVPILSLGNILALPFLICWSLSLRIRKHAFSRESVHVSHEPFIIISSNTCGRTRTWFLLCLFRILERRNHLLSQIEEVRRTRALQRASRRRHGGTEGQGLATVAIVGYTNAVCSSITGYCYDSIAIMLYSMISGSSKEKKFTLVF